MGRAAEAIAALIRERLKTIETEQKALKAALKELDPRGQYDRSKKG